MQAHRPAGDGVDARVEWGVFGHMLDGTSLMYKLRAEDVVADEKNLSGFTRRTPQRDK
jgi:hypothetical protein